MRTNWNTKHLNTFSRHKSENSQCNQVVATWNDFPPPEKLSQKSINYNTYHASHGMARLDWVRDGAVPGGALSVLTVLAALACSSSCGKW